MNSVEIVPVYSDLTTRGRVVCDTVQKVLNDLREKYRFDIDNLTRDVTVFALDQQIMPIATSLYNTLYSHDVNVNFSILYLDQTKKDWGVTKRYLREEIFETDSDILVMSSKYVSGIESSLMDFRHEFDRHGRMLYLDIYPPDSIHCVEIDGLQ